MLWENMGMEDSFIVCNYIAFDQEGQILWLRRNPSYQKPSQRAKKLPSVITSESWDSRAYIELWKHTTSISWENSEKQSVKPQWGNLDARQSSGSRNQSWGGKNFLAEVDIRKSSVQSVVGRRKDGLLASVELSMVRCGPAFLYGWVYGQRVPCVLGHH